MLPTRLISELNASAVHAYLHHCIQQGHVKDAEGTLSIIKNAVVILNTQTDRFECIGERDTLYQYLSSREAPRLSNGEIYDPEHHVIIDVQNRFDIIFRHYCTDVEGYLQRLLDSNAVDEQDLLEHFDRPISSFESTTIEVAGNYGVQILRMIYENRGHGEYATFEHHDHSAVWVAAMSNRRNSLERFDFLAEHESEFPGEQVGEERLNAAMSAVSVRNWPILERFFEHFSNEIIAHPTFISQVNIFQQNLISCFMPEDREEWLKFPALQMLYSPIMASLPLAHQMMHQYMHEQIQEGFVLNHQGQMIDQAVILFNLAQQSSLYIFDRADIKPWFITLLNDPDVEQENTDSIRLVNAPLFRSLLRFYAQSIEGFSERLKEECSATDNQILELTSGDVEIFSAVQSRDMERISLFLNHSPDKFRMKPDIYDDFLSMVMRSPDAHQIFSFLSPHHPLPSDNFGAREPRFENALIHSIRYSEFPAFKAFCDHFQNKLIENPSFLSQHKYKGRNALHYSAWAIDTSFMLHLITVFGMDPNETAPQGQSALALLTNRSLPSQVKFLSALMPLISHLLTPQQAENYFKLLTSEGATLSALQLALKHPELFLCRLAEDQTITHWAALAGDQPSIISIIEQVPDQLFITDAHEKSAISYLFVHSPMSDVKQAFQSRAELLKLAILQSVYEQSLDAFKALVTSTTPLIEFSDLLRLARMLLTRGRTPLDRLLILLATREAPASRDIYFKMLTHLYQTYIASGASPSSPEILSELIVLQAPYDLIQLLLNEVEQSETISTETGLLPAALLIKAGLVQKYPAVILSADPRAQAALDSPISLFEFALEHHIPHPLLVQMILRGALRAPDGTYNSNLLNRCFLQHQFLPYNASTIEWTPLVHQDQRGRIDAIFCCLATSRAAIKSSSSWASALKVFDEFTDNQDDILALFKSFFRLPQQSAEQVYTVLIPLLEQRPSKLALFNRVQHFKSKFTTGPCAREHISHLDIKASVVFLIPPEERNTLLPSLCFYRTSAGKLRGHPLRPEYFPDHPDQMVTLYFKDSEAALKLLMRCQAVLASLLDKRDAPRDVSLLFQSKTPAVGVRKLAAHEEPDCQDPVRRP